MGKRWLRPFGWKRRVWFAVGIALLAGLIAVAAFEPYRIVPGLLRSETFYQMRPTSYWRTKLLACGRAGRITPSDMSNYKFRAVPMLRECLRDEDRNVRWVAAALIGNLRHGNEAVPALRDALNDSDNEVRLQAIIALGQHGPNAFAAAPDLVERLHDTNEQIAHEADIALWLIAPKLAVTACGWKPFESAAWQFTAEFPVPPKETTREVPSPFGPATIHMWLAMHGVVACSVAVTEYAPGSGKAMTDDDWFDGTNAAGPLFGFEILREEPIELDGFKGREKLAENKSFDGRTLSRAFRVGDRLYHVQAAFNPKYVSPGAVRYFLDSFHIRETPTPKP